MAAKQIELNTSYTSEVMDDTVRKHEENRQAYFDWLLQFADDWPKGKIKSALVAPGNKCVATEQGLAKIIRPKTASQSGYEE